MLNNKLNVMLWDEPVGKLYWDARGNRAVFTYDPAFVKKGLDISPLKNSIAGTAGKGFPVAGNRDKLYKGLPEFLSDSLPDKWGSKVFEHWAMRNKIPLRKLNAVDMLSFIGKRAMGALEFVPDVEDMLTDKDLRIDELYRISKDIFESRSQAIIRPEDDLTLQALYEIGTSAGGMHPKAIIAINQISGDVKSGQIALGEDYKYYILKFAENDEFPYTLIEKTYYDMATLAHIDMMPSSLYEVEGIKHFLTERYDRQNGEKKHVLTLAAINPGMDSYEGLFDTAFELNVPEAEIRQLFRRMVFNVFAANVDDHVKNFSFMMGRDGSWHITPAYDLMFTVNIRGMGYENCHSMTISGKSSDIEVRDLVDFAGMYAIRNANRILDEVASAVAQFRRLAESNGVDAFWIDNIEACLHELVPQKYQHMMTGYLPTVVEPYQEEGGRNVEEFSLTETHKHDFHIEAVIDGKRYKYIVGHKKELAAEIIAAGRDRMPVEMKKRLIRELLIPKVNNCKLRM